MTGSSAAPEDLADLLRSIAGIAAERTEADFAAVGLLGPDGTLRDFLHVGMDPGTAALIGALPTGRGVLGLPIADARPLRLADVSADPASAGVPAGHPPMGPFLGVPVRLRDDSVVGHLYVTRHPGAAPFEREHQQVVEALAATAALVMEQAQHAALETDHRTGARVQFLLEHLSDAVMLVDMNAVITYAAGAVPETFGRPAGELLGRHWAGLVTPDEQPTAARLLTEAFRDGRATGELQVVTADGSLRHVDVTISAPPQASAGLVITHHDATERHLLQTHLVDQAFHDPLTGLANRALFRERLGSARAKARAEGDEFLVMFIDLDDFKNVNDSLGHPAGDLLLRHVARRLGECLREGDTAARTGGDEFAVLLQDRASVAEGTQVAERILAAIREPLLVGDTSLVSHATIGLAVGAGDVGSDELERNADLAMYRAKSLGKDRFAFYEPSLHTDAVAEMTLVNELRRALMRSEFVPFFQPVMALDGSGIAGVECLVRWQHPARGLLGPEEFLGPLESTGLIEELGQAVLGMALRSLAGWRATIPSFHELRMAVNVSPRQLLSEAFVDQVRRQLTLADVPPRLLVLEITESALWPDERTGAQQLRDLCDLGVSIYLDDFGTGWSSLRSLRNLPFDGLKLAGEFVHGLPDPAEVGVVQAIRDLALSLGVPGLVAEGVETAAQRRALLALGYRLAQGYLLGEPLSGAAFGDLLMNSSPTPWSTTAAVGRPATPAPAR